MIKPELPYLTNDAGEEVFPPRILPDILAKAVASWPEKISIDYFGRTWTFGEIGEQVDRAARGLQDLGLQPGDRIGLCMGNSPYHVVLYFAVLQIGGVIVNVNPLYTKSEMTHLVMDSGMRIIAVPEYRAIHTKIEEVAEKSGIAKIIVCRMSQILPPLKSVGFRLLRRSDHVRITKPDLHVELGSLLANDDAPLPVKLHPDDLAVLQYTGGTTGSPKGAMLTHASLAANSAQMLRHYDGYSPQQERTLGVLPLFHVFALTCVLNYSIESGTELVMLPRFEMPNVLAALKRKPPTRFFGVPTIFSGLNALPQDDLPDMSKACCISGGAPLPLEVREMFEAKTGARVVEGYGLSEASPIIACNPLFGLVKDNSCGPNFPGTILEIRNPDAPDQLCETGERGEVMVRGPQVMKGYWRNAAATEETFYDGALRTGDIGILDEDGYLFLVDRIKDIILCGGFNVYPRVIEDGAYQHPDVREAIAIGIPDSYRGETPKLFVTLTENSVLSVSELKAFLAEVLNKIEMPTEIEIRDSLPKTLIGKLSKKELVEEERAKQAVDDQ